MRTIFQSLAWKEWHEHKWKLVALTVIMFGVVALPLLDLDRGTLIGIAMGVAVGLAPLSIFIGLGTAAGERSRGTMRFLQALPVPMWRVALHKLFFGLGTAIVPALLTQVFVAAWCALYGLFGIKYEAAADFTAATNGLAQFMFLTNSFFFDGCLMAFFVAASMFLWTVAVGVNRKDEVSAGAVALAAIVGWCLLVAAVWNLAITWYGPSESWPRFPGQLLGTLAIATAPGGMLTLTNVSDPFAPLVPFGMGAAIFSYLALAACYVARFGRISNLEVRSPREAALDPQKYAYLGPSRRSPFTAIAWKQFRESGSIALAGLAIVGVISALFCLGNGFRSDLSIRDTFGGFFGRSAIAVGYGLAIVMGIGVMLGDVRPGLNTFWRSRPISADLWFWVKYLSGLAVLLTAIYLPIGIMLLMGVELSVPRVTLADVAAMPAIHVTSFAAAVAMTCLVRNAVYAAILSIAWTYIGLVMTALALMVGRLLGWIARTRDNLFDMELSDQQVLAALAVSFVASTLLAWLATRNDWGQKFEHRP